jgi:hypothetical protein
MGAALLPNLGLSRICGINTVGATKMLEKLE